MNRVTGLKQTKIWRAGLLWALFSSCFQAVACGGMTAEDGADGTGGSDGGVSSGGTTAGGGTAAVGGTNAAGGGVGPGGTVGVGGASDGTGGAAGGSGGGPSKTACSSDSECVVVPTGCCGACEPVTAEAVEAVSAAWQAQAPVCDVVCGACYEVSEVDATRDYFVSQCREGQCTLVDIRDDDTECNTGEDCVLYNGNDCCQECDASGYIAVSSFEFLGDRCDDAGACPPCVPTVPEGLSAQCNLETNRCEKVQQ